MKTGPSEVFYDRNVGLCRTRSAMIGAIWQVQDNIAVGLRCARSAREWPHRGRNSHRGDWAGPRKWDRWL